MVKSNRLDMTSGPLTGKIISFALPVLLTNILQLLYNSADMMVVGRFAEDGAGALAAVGSTGTLFHLITNVFIGFSIGTGVVVAQAIGAQDRRRTQNLIETSILLTVISSVIVASVGYFIAEPLLRMMKTDPEVLGQATLYLRIVLIGSPTLICYNFGAAILRAYGDTKRPLYFLLISGTLNVALNLVFVIGFRMDVAGVALATVISQLVSSIFVWRYILRKDFPYRPELKHMKFHWDCIKEILRIGIPTGLQSSMFSISNILMQSTINSLGKYVMAGSAAAINIEMYLNQVNAAIGSAAMTFAGQNVGAQKPDRVKKVMWISLGVAVVADLVLGSLLVIFGEQLLWLFNTDPLVIRYGMIRVVIMCSCYALSAGMEVLGSHIRGMGYSTLPTMVNLVCICVFRILFILFLYPILPQNILPFLQNQTEQSFFYVIAIFPISYVLTVVGLSVTWVYYTRKMCRTMAQRSE